MMIWAAHVDIGGRGEVHIGGGVEARGKATAWMSYFRWENKSKMDL
jgi:hypothetical protein